MYEAHVDSKPKLIVSSCSCTVSENIPTPPWGGVNGNLKGEGVEKCGAKLKFLEGRGMGGANSKILLGGYGYFPGPQI